MHSEFTYDLIGIAIVMLNELTESQAVVEHFSKEEIELVRLLLWFLTVTMLGPRPTNQLKISRSEAIIALNIIIPAESEVEDIMKKEDPSYVDMKTLSLKV